SITFRARSRNSWVSRTVLFIPAQPHRDVTWISYREKNVLLAGDLRDIDGDLRTSGQNRESHERQHQPDPIESVHRLTPIVQGIDEAIPIAGAAQGSRICTAARF